MVSTFSSVKSDSLLDKTPVATAQSLMDKFELQVTAQTYWQVFTAVCTNFYCIDWTAVHCTISDGLARVSTSNETLEMLRQMLGGVRHRHVLDW